MPGKPTKAQLSKARPTREWRRDNPGGHLICFARSAARKADREFDLTLRWVEDQLRTGLCAVTGIPLDIGNGGPFAPSIDRIDNSKGYTEANCRVVIWAYNRAKYIWPDEVVMQVAQALVRRSDA